MNRERPRLVYSTGPRDDSASGAGPCPRCRRDPCSCVAGEETPPSTQTVRVRRERAGRRGKTVTVAGPLVLAPPAARELLRTLQRECGSGGTLKGDRSAGGATPWIVEIQGDHVERVLGRLDDLGYRVRR